jgi:hypothetical protein
MFLRGAKCGIQIAIFLFSFVKCMSGGISITLIIIRFRNRLFEFGSKIIRSSCETENKTNTIQIQTAVEQQQQQQQRISG